MKLYFNIKLEFTHQTLENIVEMTAHKGKGYCCFVDLTSLVYSYHDIDFREILNNSTVNSCDGSYIAMSASKLHSEKLREYIGPDFFKKFIYAKKKHLIIGNTQEVFNKVKAKVELVQNTDLTFLPLPFMKVEDFDYEGVSCFINKLSPDYIWVSLGAPKQERFMNILLPKINRGMLLGVGAATNYFSGEIKDIPNWTKRLHIVWVYRIFTEPKKQLKRLQSILLTFPKMIKEEKNKLNNSIVEK
jgi:N-acetylglucosaminyldiphosphoundecaprenol N-acetyl-beta-D-mannosaminyltransferase